MLTLKTILQGQGLQDKYIPDFEELRKIVNQFRDGGFTIALTQGVFDMFHIGHARYLREARSYGDILIVGVDSDELTRSMKGENRPFDCFEERTELLSMLASVSIIARRHTDQHKYDLIELVRPDVLIMSQTTSSFTDEDKAKLNQYCGQIAHLEAQAPTSTTAKMLRLATQGAKELEKRIKRTIEEFFLESGGTR